MERRLCPSFKAARMTSPLQSPIPPPGDPSAARAALLNDLSLWFSDSLLMARRVIEGHFGATGKTPAPHELNAILQAGTALFQAAVMVQAQQQTMQHVSRQFTGVEPPPELRKALNEMMKKAPQIIDEILKETREGDEWKKPPSDEPEPPRTRRRHPEDDEAPPEGEAKGSDFKL